MIKFSIIRFKDNTARLERIERSKWYIGPGRWVIVDDFPSVVEAQKAMHSLIDPKTVMTREYYDERGNEECQF